MTPVLHIIGTPGPLAGHLAGTLAVAGATVFTTSPAQPWPGAEVPRRTWDPLAVLRTDWLSPPAADSLTDAEVTAVARHAALAKAPTARAVVVDDRSAAIGLACLPRPAQGWALVLAEAPWRTAAHLVEGHDIDGAVALALWERHLRNAVLASSSLPSVVCVLDDPTDDDEALAGAVDEVVAVLGLPADHRHQWRPAPKPPAMVDERLTDAERISLWDGVVGSAGVHRRGWWRGAPGPESAATAAVLDAARVIERSRRRSVQDSPGAGRLDRHRDLDAAAEFERHAIAQELAELHATVAELQVQRDTAVHERNLAAIELDHLEGRRSVRLAARAASDARRVLRRLLPAAVVDPVVAPPPGTTDGLDLAPLVAALRGGRLDRPVTVIVPIYNAPDSLHRCLDSLVRNTPPEVHLLLIDDASADPAVQVVLDPYLGFPNLELVRNDENLGFTRTVNRGLRRALEGDVVLLNADTVVTPGWIRRLRVAAAESPLVGTVTAMSDSAGAFSFDCPRPTSPAHADALGAAVARSSRFLRPATPTANGFCMLITAEARRAVPLLDDVAFPRGYGEENDYCMRLAAEGFTHVIADDTVVFHDESASFGDDARRSLGALGYAVLDERYPHYRQMVEDFLGSPALHEARAAAASAAAVVHHPGPTRRTRVLYALHDGGGGTDFHTRDLATGLANDVEALLLQPREGHLVLWRLAEGQWVELHRYALRRPWDIRRLRDDDVARIYAHVLTRFDISMVHVQHLIGHTFDLVELAKALDMPVVVTLHDFYTVCPAVLLLDEHGQFCGGTCTPSRGRCPLPMWIAPELYVKHNYVHVWQHATNRLLRDADALVAPSNAAARVVGGALGADLGERIEVIEHGIDVGRRRSLARRPAPDEPARLLLVGGLNGSKGADLAVELTRRAPPGQLSIEVLGEVAPEFAPHLRSHGKYRREDLMVHLAQLRPTFIGVLSTVAETFCYVLSEAWAAGVPAIVGTRGAPAERVARHGGGVIVDLGDPDAIITTLITLAHDTDAYERLCDEAVAAPVRTVADMSADHHGLYTRLGFI